jgi:putative Mg2+ transporter-C (MgtC) family protein
MPVELGWHDILLRLALTVAAGFLLGMDRSERGRAVGLRTSLLVCLAAAVAMIQANILLATAGKSPDSFAVMDVMRLPLGILTGMGFIGAGAILRRDNMVVGVTTAACLWLNTVIGLCFGGGQITLGLAALGLGLLTLSPLRWFEMKLHQDRQVMLSVSCIGAGPTETEIRNRLSAAGCRIMSWNVIIDKETSPRRDLRCEIRWPSHPTDFQAPPVIDELARHPDVVKLDWKV